MAPIVSLAGWEVAAAADDPVMQAAVVALRGQLGGAGGAGRVRLRRGGAGSGAGFTARVAPEEISINVDSPRAALDAAAWLLEGVGAVWADPGRPPAWDPRPPGIAEGIHRVEPRFAGRTLILGQDALHDDWREWVEWASWNRFNTVFFHDTPPSRLREPGERRPPDPSGLFADRGGWLFERWDADGAEIRTALAERGMSLAFGGHHLPAMVPRRHFEQHPDWFTQRRGERDPRYNFCTSSPGARAEFQANVAGFVERFAGATVYHLWADDIAGGGWCGCAACAGLSPSEQALVATNLAAEVLATAAPGSTIAHIAYHDTLAAPGSVEPFANVDALYAPRERCYAHAIDDPSCQRNATGYWPHVAGLVERFPGPRRRVQAFEYQSDAILYKGLAPMHLSTLPRDARAYAGAGVDEFQDLMVGDRPWVGPPWHAWWFGRCAWGDEDAGRDLGRFCRAVYGEAATAAERWYRAAERAYSLVLDLHDLEPMRRHDVLDFSDVPPETLALKAGECLDALAILEAEERELAGVTATGRGGEALGREQVQARYVMASLSRRANRIAAWSAALQGETARSREHLAREREAAARVAAWDEAHNRASYAVISHGARAAEAWHAGQIAELADDIADK